MRSIADRMLSGESAKVLEGYPLNSLSMIEQHQEAARSFYLD